jgi:ABC-type lipoprotein export system ATPase subunit
MPVEGSGAGKSTLCALSSIMDEKAGRKVFVSCCLWMDTITPELKLKEISPVPSNNI